jgi:hypothetical protein
LVRFSWHRLDYAASNLLVPHAVILPVNASTWKNFSPGFPLWGFPQDRPSITSVAKGHPNYHDRQGSQKTWEPFSGCDDSFYGLGLLVKYDSKEAGSKHPALKTEELEVKSQNPVGKEHPSRNSGQVEQRA